MIDIINKYQLSIRINNGSDEFINGGTDGLIIEHLSPMGEHYEVQSVYLTPEERDELYYNLHKYYTQKKGD